MGLIIFGQTNNQMLNKKHILDRFISYVKIDTESDPKSNSTPSTLKQWELARLV